MTNEMLMLQPTKIVHSKIEVLDKNDIVIGEIQGVTSGGDVTIDNNTMTRRTLNMSFVATDDIEISPKSLLWINKKIRVFVGVEDYSGYIHYIKQGIFVISNPTTTTSVNGREISISGYDKMKQFDRPFKFETVLKAGTPIHKAIRGLGELVGETKFMLEDSGFTLPYDIKANVGNKIEDTLKEVTNLYMNWQTYYNLDGYLVYDKMQNRVHDIPVWDFKDGNDFTVDRRVLANYDGVKNFVKVLGKQNTTQPKYEMSVTDANNPLCIAEIGERPLVVTDDKYWSVAQCKSRCEYELSQSKNLVNGVDITSAPIYIINDVNKIVKAYDNGNELVCQIDRIMMPLTYDGTMNLSAHQVFI